MFGVHDTIVAIATPKSATIATVHRTADDAISGSSWPGGGEDEVMWERITTGSQSSSSGTPSRIACEALVMITPIAEKAIIVVGRPSVWPSISDSVRPKRRVAVAWRSGVPRPNAIRMLIEALKAVDLPVELLGRAQ